MICRCDWETPYKKNSALAQVEPAVKATFFIASRSHTFPVFVPYSVPTVKTHMRAATVASSAQRTHTGFTLIELVMAIVILGVLAATALPRFVNLRGSANEATIRAMGGALLSSANLVYAKSAIKGVQGQATTNIDINGDGVNDVEVAYGYPSAHRSNGIPKVMEPGFASGWTWSGNGANTVFFLTTAALGKRSGLYVNNTAVQASNCYLLYSRATSSTPPTIAYVTTGC